MPEQGEKVDFVAVDIFPDEWIYDMRPDGLTVRDKFEIGMAPLAGHYRVMQMPSVDAAAQFADGSLDFVFIDAAHDYASVCADIAAWTPKVKPGGIIAGHDYERYYENTVVRAVDETFGSRVQKVQSEEQDHLFCWKVQL